MSPPALPMTTTAPAICGAPVLEYSPCSTTTQHAARPIAALFSGSKTQICLPVVATSAYTTPRLPDVYMTPSTTSGVAAIPREVLVLYSHANLNPATLPALIRCNGE